MHLQLPFLKSGGDYLVVFRIIRFVEHVNDAEWIQSRHLRDITANKLDIRAPCAKIIDQGWTRLHHCEKSDLRYLEYEQQIGSSKHMSNVH